MRLLRQHGLRRYVRRSVDESRALRRVRSRMFARRQLRKRALPGPISAGRSARRRAGGARRLGIRRRPTDDPEHHQPRGGRMGSPAPTTSRRFGVRGGGNTSHSAPGAVLKSSLKRPWKSRRTRPNHHLTTLRRSPPGMQKPRLVMGCTSSSTRNRVPRNFDCRNALWDLSRQRARNWHTITAAMEPSQIRSIRDAVRADGPPTRRSWTTTDSAEDLRQKALKMTAKGRVFFH